MGHHLMHMSRQNSALTNLALTVSVVDAVWRVTTYIVTAVLVLLVTTTAATYLWRRKQSGVWLYLQ